MVVGVGVTELPIVYFFKERNSRSGLIKQWSNETSTKQSVCDATNGSKELSELIIFLLVLEFMVMAVL